MSRTAGACFLIGGVLVALITALSSDSFHSVAVQYGNAAAAAVVGICVLLMGHRITSWQFQLLVITAMVQITVSVLESTDATVAVSFATLYVFPFEPFSPSNPLVVPLRR